VGGHNRAHFRDFLAVAHLLKPEIIRGVGVPDGIALHYRSLVSPGCPPVFIILGGGFRQPGVAVVCLRYGLGRWITGIIRFLCIAGG